MSHEHDGRNLDYNQITDEIFVGTNACCQAGYAEELLDKEIRGDISLEKERIDNPDGVDYFLWLPVEDHAPPSMHQLRLGVTMLNYFVREKMKVYVHCKNGHGRAPTLVMAYFISTGMTPREAHAFVEKKRSSIHLEESQKKALEEFALSTL